MAGAKNPSETFVAQLAQRTFLRFWSFPNVYRMAGRTPKEICDLLVVYDQSILIFSVKFAQFDVDVPLDTAWRRWFKRAVESSARQLSGADRYLGNLGEHPDKVFLDQSCAKTLPVPLPIGANRRVYRILVALGIGSACRRFLSGSGSLLLCPSVSDAEHYDYPFHIGAVQSQRPYLHVFDDITLALTLRELDTITDFSEYLDARRSVLTSGRIARCDGEENLLAGYLQNRAGKGDKFGLPKTKKLLIIQDGGWKRIEADPQYQARRRADRQSYLWDRLIDIIWKSSYDAPGDAPRTASPTSERIARHMASERRFARRQLASGIIGFAKHAPPNVTSRRAMVMDITAPRMYVLVIMPRGNWPDAEYRERRRGVLSEYAFVAAYLHRETHSMVIGIAMEHPTLGKESFDAVTMEVVEWTPEILADAEKIRTTNGYFRGDARITRGKDREFPDVRVVRQGNDQWLKTPRNSPCPCGSNRKFKHCHGRSRNEPVR